MKNYYIDPKGNKRRFKFDAGDVVLTLNSENKLVPHLIVFDRDRGYNFIYLDNGTTNYNWECNPKSSIYELLVDEIVVDVIRNKDFIKQFAEYGYDVIYSPNSKEDIVKFDKMEDQGSKNKMLNRLNKDTTVLELLSKTNINECWEYFQQCFFDDKVYCDFERFESTFRKFQSKGIEKLPEQFYVDLYVNRPDDIFLSCTSEYALECYTMSQVNGFKIRYTDLKDYEPYMVIAHLIWKYTFTTWDNEYGIQNHVEFI